MRICLVILLSCISACCTAASSPFPNSYVANPNRTLVLGGEVGENAVKIADALVGLASTGPDPIDLIINSPGGSIVSGMTLMSAMDAVKAQGIPIRCFVPVYAASMAFHILGNCTERYALHYTLLLFHPARITGDKRGMTQDELVYHAARMKVEEDELDGRLRRALRMDPVLFAYHHQHETFWLAQEFTSVAPGFIVIVDTYENVPGAFKMEE